MNRTKRARACSRAGYCAGAVKRISAGRGRDKGLKLHGLLSGKCGQLIAGLRDLEVTDVALALGDEGVERHAVGAKLTDDFRLDFEAVLEALTRQRPGLVGIGDDLRGGDCRGILFGEQPAVFAVDDRNLIGDPSVGGNQRIDPRERRPEIGRHGMRQVGQALRLVDQHLGLVGELLHLIADLLEGTRRRQNVLGVVGRIIDDITFPSRDW